MNINELKSELCEIDENTAINKIDKLKIIHQLFLGYLSAFCLKENLHFSTSFAKCSFISTKHGFPSQFTFHLHTFRRYCENNDRKSAELEKYISLGLFCCFVLHYVLEENGKTAFDLPAELKSLFPFRNKDNKSYHPIINGLIISFEEGEKAFYFIEEGAEHLPKKIRYDQVARNELFTKSVDRSRHLLQLPFSVNLIDVNISIEEEYSYQAIIINPDYLIDVTTIAQFKGGDENNHFLYVLDKLSYKSKSTSILVGNLVNFIFDNLLQDENMAYEVIIKKFYKEDPFFWATLDDETVKAISEKAYLHYLNLKRTIEDEFKSLHIEKKNLLIEPAFLSHEYGIQGRLDLLHCSNDFSQNEIIELKSSKIFKPNAYGINDSHYNQCLLYDMLIKTTILHKKNSLNYVLYSSLDSKALKFAPAMKSKQYELLKYRNEIYLIDYGFNKSPELSYKIINYLKTTNFNIKKDFVFQDLNLFEGIFASLDVIEKKYFAEFNHFVFKELMLNKIGDGEDRSEGLASIWLKSINEKAEKNTILSYLTIEQNLSEKEIPTIKLLFSEFSNKISNFRIGDIVMLLPHTFKARDVLKYQIFKATILSLDKEGVTILLRNPQKNQSIFKDVDFWNIEPDILDSSFRSMNKNLFLFASASMEKRRLILGIDKPKYHQIEGAINLSDELTIDQKNIVLRLFYCQDYMLLWGPPGTGKTSMIIKHLTRLIFDNSAERIMLIAYTNRAVDEICQALVQIGLGSEVSRIGSNHSTHPNYKDLLINNQIEGISNRKDLIKFLESKRIYVSTVASFTGKLDLLDIISFDTLIIDEASQILEPMICGILTLFNRFILIGDHKQLPAIVKQSKDESIVEDPMLRELGLEDRRISLFERLYKKCASHRDWQHTIAQLNQQGRMHEKIMEFVNIHFYESSLKVIPGLEELKQIGTFMNTPNHALNKGRILFCDVKQPGITNSKTNESEAEAIAQIVKMIMQDFETKNIPLTSETIGIITPFRAQISMLKKLLPDNGDLITIDTVERYQGSARSIIIMSLVVGNERQFKSILSETNDGIDRKLNVAITRSRKQIILVGDKKLLSTNKIYKHYIDYAQELKL
jgi:DNA replication ATP-dependent helicase Dna2